jgi:hypothetical protein
MPGTGENPDTARYLPFVYRSTWRWSIASAALARTPARLIAP